MCPTFFLINNCMPLYSLENLQKITIELTANCNAMCPGCDRWNKGSGGINSFVEQNLGTKGHMPLETFLSAFPNSLFKKNNNDPKNRFRSIEFNGSVGDAILHPRFVNYLKILNSKNDLIEHEPFRVGLKLATNAGLHGKEFWTEVGKQFVRSNVKTNLIMVALDGTTNEVHQQYRRGVDFQKALDNAKTLIDTGANVRWQFIEFKHNRHQIEEAKELAKKYGFTDIEIRNSRGGNAIYGNWATQVMAEEKIELDDKSIKKDLARQAAVEKRQTTRVESKIGKLNKKFEYKQTDKIKETVNKLKDIKDPKKYLLEEVDIKCQWGSLGQINIEFTGAVHACCHMNTGVFYPRELYPKRKDSYEFYEYMNSHYEEDWHILSNRNDLEKILNHNFFKKDLEESWKPDTDSDKLLKRLSVCVQTCTKEDLAEDTVISNDNVDK